MIKLLFKRVITTSLGRWALGGAVALLLGTAGLLWHNFKQDLRNEGKQVCVQVINEQTMLDLQAALATERATAMELRVIAVAAAAENQEARARLRASQFTIDALETARKNQEERDELYKAWSNTSLPNGVADRLRGLRAGRDADTNTEAEN